MLKQRRSDFKHEKYSGDSTKRLHFIYNVVQGRKVKSELYVYQTVGKWELPFRMYYLQN